jgi:hypothetical protein
MERPAGVTWVAALFILTAAYLAGAGLLLLLRPGTIPLTSGSSFLGGLELAGPYMFLLAGVVLSLIGWGLLRLSLWARRAALLVALAGVVLLVPTVSSAVINFRAITLFWGALGVILRVMIIWYLWQEHVGAEFV